MKRRLARQESGLRERTYRIGEAARLLKLESFVLRFWETAFPRLRPVRTPKGQRLYSESDLALLRQIRFLLHEQGMTIEGARRMLDGNAPENPSTEPPCAVRNTGELSRTLRDTLSHVERELLTLKKLLENESL